MNQAFEQSILRNLDRIERQDLENYLTRSFDEKYLIKKAWDALASAIVILDQDNCIVKFNQATHHFLTRRSANFTGKFLIDCIDHPDLKLSLQKLLSEGQASESMEVTVFDETSKDYFIDLFHFEHLAFSSHDPQSSSPKTPPCLYKILLISNITDWKNKNLAEDQRKSIDSLQTLTAGIAHEIKNPLAAVDLHLQLIQRAINSTRQPKRDAKLNQWLGVVSEEIKRLEAIVNDFLFSFRPMRPMKTPLKLNDIILEIIDFLKPQCQEKRILIKTKLDPEMKTFLFDKNQIKQALINLIHNSIEAIEENPQIDGEGLITVTTNENHQTIRVVITDNGAGIPGNKVVDIFKPFYTSKKMGTGLGLSIVSRIVHQHQGEIILNTDYQNGTQFQLEFSRLPPIQKNKQIAHQK